MDDTGHDGRPWTQSTDIGWRQGNAPLHGRHATRVDIAAARLIEAMASFDAAPTRDAGALFNAAAPEATLDTAKSLGAHHREHLEHFENSRL
jgi:hypothetical protein